MALESEIRREIAKLNHRQYSLYEEIDRLAPDGPPAETDEVFEEWNKIKEEIFEIDDRIEELEIELTKLIAQKQEKRLKESLLTEDKSPADIAQEEWEAEREAERARKQWEAERAELEKAVEKAAEEKSRLAQLAREADEKNEKDKGRRTLYVLLFYTVAFIVIFYWQGWFDEPTVENIIGTIVVAFVFAGICLFINLIIFSTLTTKGREGDNHVKYLAKRYEEATKELERKIEEKKRFEENPPYSN